MGLGLGCWALMSPASRFPPGVSLLLVLTADSQWRFGEAAAGSPR